MAKKKRSSKKVSGRRPRGGSGSGSDLVSVSSDALQAELARRQRAATSLLRKRDRLRTQLAEVEAEIREAGLGSVGGGGTRPRNAMNLVEAMQQVLDGAELTVTELAEAVQRAGYQTSSPNFRTIVNQTLIKHKNIFKRVSRGVYTAK
ncbi:MAG: hypothetical protein AAGF47_11840 [Planctomycetota bacterium]